MNIICYYTLNPTEREPRVIIFNSLNRNSILDTID